MPRKEYNKRLTNLDILELFKNGSYWADLNEGVVYSDHKRAAVYTYEGNAEGHLFIRLYSEPKHRAMPVSHVVWMFGTRVPLPDGWQVHHRDKDVQNNSFDNLIAVHPIDHRKLHAGELVDEEPIPF